jgi:hypothetical protein
MADMEQGKPPVKPAKPSRPPSPVLPRLVALSAIVTLLAIPIVVPVVVMKTTGTSGKPAGLSLADAIEAPVDVEATPLEEDTVEELQESFLKISNSTVRCCEGLRARRATRRDRSKRCSIVRLQRALGAASSVFDALARRRRAAVCAAAGRTPTFLHSP